MTQATASSSSSTRASLVLRAWSPRQPTRHTRQEIAALAQPSVNRQELVVVGWSDLEGSRPHFGALLLGYYTDGGKLIYAGRVGTGTWTRCSPICGADLTR